MAAEPPGGAALRAHAPLPVGRDRTGSRELYEGEIDDYAQGVTDAVVRDVAAIDRRITEAAAESGWTADRLGAVERNILRIAIHELDTARSRPEPSSTRPSPSPSSIRRGRRAVW